MNRREFLGGVAAAALAPVLPEGRTIGRWVHYGIDLAEPGADATVWIVVDGLDTRLMYQVYLYKPGVMERAFAAALAEEPILQGER